VRLGIPAGRSSPAKRSAKALAPGVGRRWREPKQDPIWERGSSIWAESCRDVGGERQAAATMYGRESCEEENEAGGGRGGRGRGRAGATVTWRGGWRRAAPGDRHERDML
jgi:hypothetical protein